MAVRPSTTAIWGSGADTLGFPSTITSTLVSVAPSLLRAVHTYVPLSSGRAASIFTGAEIHMLKAPISSLPQVMHPYLHNSIGLHGNGAGQQGLAVTVQPVP